MLMDAVFRSARVVVLPLSLTLQAGCLVLNPDFDPFATGEAESGAPREPTSTGEQGSTGKGSNGDESVSGGTTGDPSVGGLTGTHDPTADPCPACDATKATCEESVPCQAIAALAEKCPPEDVLNCVKELGCAILTPSAAGEGFGLWSAWISCVSHECLGAPPTCVEQRALCLGDKECSAIDACITDQCTCITGDAALACWDACADEHPQGRDTWNDWYACLWP